MGKTKKEKNSVSEYSIDPLYDAAHYSFCWKFFGSLVITENNKKRVVDSQQVFCSACLDKAKSEIEDATIDSVKIKCYKRTVSTGNLIRHLREAHDIIGVCTDEVNDPPPKKKSTQSSSSCTDEVKNPPKKRKKSSSKARDTSAVFEWKLARDMALWFCKSLLPFDIVSDEGMVEFFKKYKITGANDGLPSHNTVSCSALSDVYENVLNNVKEKIYNDSSRHCAMSFDFWTDHFRRLEYITVTLHYLTVDFELKSLTLNTQVMTDKSSKELDRIVVDTKKKFKLEEKYIHAVIENSNEIIQAISSGYVDHHLCLGHGLHKLVTEDGLQGVPEIRKLVIKCKKIGKTVRYRLPQLKSKKGIVQNKLLDTLEEVIETLEIDENEPISPTEGTQRFGVEIVIPTRWHCVLEMLECFINFGTRDRINNIIEKDELKITQTEWILMEELVKFLKRFCYAIEILSLQKTCTLNLAIVFLSEIIDILQTQSDDESSILFRLRSNMLANIDKKIPITKAVVAAALLDRRFMELKEVALYLESKNTTKVSFLTTYVKEVIKVEDLVGAKLDMVAVKMEMELDNIDPLSASNSPAAAKCSFDDDDQEADSDTIEQECQRYFASVTRSEIEFREKGPLRFWNEKKKDFPWLSALARALLCVPAINMPSERIFTLAGMRFFMKRSHLSPNIMNKILFIHNNYKEYENED